MPKTQIKDPVRELYLEKCTPEQHIQLLEIEIKMNEDKVLFYENSPLYANPIKKKIMMDKYAAHIQNKYRQIEKLKKQINTNN